MKIFTLAKYITFGDLLIYQDELYKVYKRSAHGLFPKIDLRLGSDNHPTSPLNLTLPGNTPLQRYVDPGYTLAININNHWHQVTQLHLGTTGLRHRPKVWGKIIGTDGQEQDHTWQGQDLRSAIHLFGAGPISYGDFAKSSHTLLGYLTRYSV